jgi:cyclopropane-fatty-acyl-phospholipid synthase
MKSANLVAKYSLFSQTGLASGLLRRTVLRQLAQLRHGSLRVLENGELLQFGDPASGLQAEIEVLDPALWSMVAGNGSVGAGEAYIHGYWRSADLTAVIRVFVSNLEVLDGMESGLALLGRPALKALHWINRNTRKGSQKNISAHYDLGNDLFEQFLDPTMMYSAAMFIHADDTLEQAQLNKLERICQKLELKPSDHLLEIGTGWGSMALYAATHYGCRVTTTTLSQEQFAYTRRRIEEQNLQDRVTLLLRDYRDLEGQYDKAGLDRDDRSRRPPLPAHLLQAVRPPAQTGRTDAAAGHHHPRPALRASQKLGGLHPALHLPRRCPAVDEQDAGRDQ